MGRLFVITGPRGVGKSTLCDRVADQVASRGFCVGGIVTRRDESPGSAEAQADRRRLVDLGTGKCISFGYRASESGKGGFAGGVPAGGATSTDELTPGWKFEREVFAFGERAIAAGADGDLLVVDEIGPLELLGDRGWVGSLAVLRGGRYRGALVVCRPQLVDVLGRALGLELSPNESSGKRSRVYVLTVDTRGAVETAIVQDVLQALNR